MSSPSVSRPPRVVFYARMSSDRQEDSIPQQTRWAQAKAAADRLTLVSSFCDEGVSGHETSRPGLTALLEFCRAESRRGSPVDAVLVWKPDRLSRADSQATGWLLWELRQAGVWSLVCNDKTYDLETDTDRLLLGVSQDFTAHRYSKDLADNTTRAKLDRASEGKHTGGRVPYGYRIRWKQEGGRPVPDCYVPDPPAAEVVRWVFITYAAGTHSLRDIVNELAGRKEPTPSQRLHDLGQWRGRVAAEWSATMVRNLLTHPVYLGSMVWNRTHQGRFLGVVDMKVTPMPRRGKRRQVRNAPADHVRKDSVHDALVDQATFDLCSRRLAEQRRNTTPVRNSDFTLTRLLYCGHCGGRMIGRTKRGTHIYSCGRYLARGLAGCNHNRIEEAPLTRCVLRKIQDRFTPEAVERVRELVEEHAGADPLAGEVNRLEAAHVEAAARAKTAVRRAATERDDTLADAYRDEARQLLAEAEAARVALDVAKRAVAEQVSPDEVVERAVAVVTDMAALADGRAPAELRTFLRDHVERIELTFAHTPDKAGRNQSRFLKGRIYLREDSPLSSCLLTSSKHPLQVGFIPFGENDLI